MIQQYYSRENQNLKGYMHPTVHNNPVYNIEEMEAIYMTMTGEQIKKMYLSTMKCFCCCCIQLLSNV